VECQQEEDMHRGQQGVLRRALQPFQPVFLEQFMVRLHEHPDKQCPA
jgi:hypothetical protein